MTFSSANSNRQFEWRGAKPPSNRSWGYPLERLEELWAQGRILTKQDGTPRLDGLKVYLDETKGKPLTTLWDDVERIGNTSSERIGYPTQKPEAIRRYLPDAEIIFEWRHNPNQTHYDFRKNWRDAFVEVDDDIWKTINDRNIRIPFQEGFFQREVWGFDEKSIREAVHNAVMHRNYTYKNRSIFIKASPEAFNVESPGGLLPGITLENILYERAWRNRTLAEAFEKIGFAERSGQGLDDIFERSIKDGKGLPDLSKTTKDLVRLSIPRASQRQGFYFISGTDNQ